MRILLTGSNGFVGGATARILRSRGITVVGMGTKRDSLTAVDDYVQHDIRHPLPKHLGRFDAIIHCAALASPWAPPQEFQAINVDGTRNVLDLCASQPQPHLVYISSSSVFYRNADQFGITERTPKPALENQINVYSRTKLMGEHLVERSSGPWAILRPRAVFGPGDTVVFPRILRLAKTGRFPRFLRKDGKKVVTDLVYIDVLAEYIADAVERRFTGDLNITNNQPVVMYDLLESVFSSLGMPVQSRQVKVKTALFLARIAELVSATFFSYREPPLTRFGVSVFAYSKTFDVEKTIRSLGAPRISIEEGVRRFLAWWKKEGDCRS